MTQSIRIGTRKSPLAMWQAEYVRDRLQSLHKGLEVELVPIETKGDKILDVALSKVGGKGLFVKELEVALLEGSVDICVHSTKDMPAELPEGLSLAVFPPRADPRDALVMGGHGGLAALPRGARVGTSSLRRQAQILAVRPDIEIVSVRGNIQTRMKKVAELNLSCVVLACAGIERMAAAENIGHRFSPDEMLPAAAQGVLSIEARDDDAATLALIAPLDDALTRRACLAERAFLKTLGGGCQVPIAAYATEDGELMTLRGLVADPSGRILVRGVKTGPKDDPVALGHALGAEVLGTGGRRILVESGLDVAPSSRAEPLADVGVVVVRDDAPDDSISTALFAAGATVVPLPLMKLAAPDDGAPLERAVRGLSQYDVLAFTSGIAVERFVHAMRAASVDARALKADVVIAAVGPATARALADNGFVVDVTGDAGGDALAHAVQAATAVDGKRVLFPRSDDGRDELTTALTAKGATVDVVAAYRHVPRDDASQTVAAAVRDVAALGRRAIVFTSPRRVEYFRTLVDDDALRGLKDFVILALGETTADAVRTAGLGTPVVVERATPAAVVAALST